MRRRDVGRHRRTKAQASNGLGARQAMAWIVNELVTNSLKYAFGEDGGTIRVTFAADPALGEGCLTVQDDGRGMPAKGNGASREGGLGLKLIEAFVQQLNGRLERDEVERGTQVRACFPLAGRRDGAFGPRCRLRHAVR